jgi:hypothetical protein
MTSDAEVAVKAKNLKLSKSLHEQAHTLWLHERQALEEVSKDRAIVKQEEAAEAHAASEAATLTARMDKHLAAVNAGVRALCFACLFLFVFDLFMHLQLCKTRGSQVSCVGSVKRDHCRRSPRCLPPPPPLPPRCPAPAIRNKYGT